MRCPLVTPSCARAHARTYSESAETSPMPAGSTAAYADGFWSWPAAQAGRAWVPEEDLVVPEVARWRRSLEVECLNM
eukprot:630541-Pelagomonas_calceolata.AAC.1